MRERAHSLFFILFHSFFSRKRKHGRMGIPILKKEKARENGDSHSKERETTGEWGFPLGIPILPCFLFPHSV